MNEVAVDWEFEQQAVESQLSRPVLVHRCTSTLGRQSSEVKQINLHGFLPAFYWTGNVPTWPCCDRRGRQLNRLLLLCPKWKQNVSAILMNP